MTGPCHQISIDNTVRQAIEREAHVVFSLSGGKDSTASAFAVNHYLDHVGHPREKRHAIHADLGMIEWRDTQHLVEAISSQLDVELVTVRRKAGGLISRWEQRWESSLRRYEALETYQLVSPWSSARLRYCTSELKVAQIHSALRKRFAGDTIVSVIGIRREESKRRAGSPISKRNVAGAPVNNRAGTVMLDWHPILDWSTTNVFDYHEAHSLPLHRAYGLGSTRLSCSYCVLASLNNLKVASLCAGNSPAYRRIVELEMASAFSFQPSRWISDIDPQLLPEGATQRIANAKLRATKRRETEALLPQGLQFQRGWPPRVPNKAEARLIAKTRTTVLSMYGLRNRWPTGDSILSRFDELHAAKTV